jgi:hypothetical protein
MCCLHMVLTLYDGQHCFYSSMMVHRKCLFSIDLKTVVHGCKFCLYNDVLIIYMSAHIILYDF